MVKSNLVISLVPQGSSNFKTNLIVQARSFDERDFASISGKIWMGWGNFPSPLGSDSPVLDLHYSVLLQSLILMSGKGNHRSCVNVLLIFFTLSCKGKSKYQFQKPSNKDPKFHILCPKTKQFLILRAILINKKEFLYGWVIQFTYVIQLRCGHWLQNREPEKYQYIEECENFGRLDLRLCELVFAFPFSKRFCKCLLGQYLVCQQTETKKFTSFGSGEKKS